MWLIIWVQVCWLIRCPPLHNKFQLNSVHTNWSREVLPASSLEICMELFLCWWIFRELLIKKNIRTLLMMMMMNHQKWFTRDQISGRLSQFKYSISNTSASTSKLHSSGGSKRSGRYDRCVCPRPKYHHHADAGSTNLRESFDQGIKESQGVLEMLNNMKGKLDKQIQLSRSRPYYNLSPFIPSGGHLNILKWFKKKCFISGNTDHWREIMNNIGWEMI